jgi:uncharacterized protein (DUF849 family)
MTRPIIITCAVTGSAPINPRNPAPITPDAIASAALDAWRAGAAIVHIHVRDPDTGVPSGDLSLYEAVVDKLRSAGCGALLNLTTGYGGRFVPDAADPRRAGPGSNIQAPELRCRHVLELRPDICSLDMGSLNFGDTVFINTPRHLETMAKLIGDAGVLPELEAFEAGHIRLARDFIDRGVLREPGWFQLCLGIAWGSPADTRTMQFLADMLPPGCHWSGFGIGASQFLMAAQAAILGGHVRVGMEDNLYLARGVPATNASLVTRAVAVVESLGHRVASPDEARSLLGM